MRPRSMHEFFGLNVQCAVGVFGTGAAREFLWTGFSVGVFEWSGLDFQSVYWKRSGGTSSGMAHSYLAS